jgi:hypothetical protein
VEGDHPLKKLRLGGTSIDSSSFSKLCGALKKNTTIELLDLSEIKSVGDSIIDLGKLFEENQTIKILNLKQIDVTSKGLSNFLESLKNNKGVEELSLSGINSFNVEGWVMLSNLLEGNKNIKRLDLKSCQLEDKYLFLLLESIERCNSLNYFELANNKKITSKGYFKLIDVLKKMDLKIDFQLI